MHSIDSQNLLILEVSSTGLGYQALNVITQSKSIRVLEASTASAGRFLILVLGPLEVLQASLESVREFFDGSSANVLLDSEILQNVSQSFLDAVYSLNQDQVGEALLVGEFASVAGLLAAAKVAVTHRLHLVDVRILRSGPLSGILLATGSTLDCGMAAADVRSHLTSSVRKGDTQVVANPTPEFRKFFNLSGEE